MNIRGKAEATPVTAEHALDLPTIDHDLSRFTQAADPFDVEPSAAHDLAGLIWLAVLSHRGDTFTVRDERGRAFRLTEQSAR